MSQTITETIEPIQLTSNIFTRGKTAENQPIITPGQFPQSIAKRIISKTKKKPAKKKPKKKKPVKKKDVQPRSRTAAQLLKLSTPRTTLPIFSRIFNPTVSSVTKSGGGRRGLLGLPKEEVEPAPTIQTLINKTEKINKILKDNGLDKIFLIRKSMSSDDIEKGLSEAIQQLNAAIVGPELTASDKKILIDEIESITNSLVSLIKFNEDLKEFKQIGKDLKSDLKLRKLQKSQFNINVATADVLGELDKAFISKTNRNQTFPKGFADAVNRIKNDKPFDLDQLVLAHNTLSTKGGIGNNDPNLSNPAKLAVPKLLKLIKQKSKFNNILTELGLLTSPVIKIAGGEQLGGKVTREGTFTLLNVPELDKISNIDSVKSLSESLSVGIAPDELMSDFAAFVSDEQSNTIGMIRGLSEEIIDIHKNKSRITGRKIPNKIKTLQEQLTLDDTPTTPISNTDLFDKDNITLVSTDPEPVDIPTSEKSAMEKAAIDARLDLLADV